MAQEDLDSDSDSLLKFKLELIKNFKDPDELRMLLHDVICNQHKLMKKDQRSSDKFDELEIDYSLALAGEDYNRQLYEKSAESMKNLKSTIDKLCLKSNGEPMNNEVKQIVELVNVQYDEWRKSCASIVHDVDMIKK